MAQKIYASTGWSRYGENERTSKSFLIVARIDPLRADDILAHSESRQQGHRSEKDHVEREISNSNYTLKKKQFESCLARKNNDINLKKD